ncbi:MAG: cation-transporting P-type ATPase [Nanoarchaeota archaeon]|nr:cation-transporting P-type ATPase [Nanoarchaeota archaeon]
MEKVHSISIEEVFQKLNTSEKGLTDEQVQKRIQIHGKNILKKTHRLRPIKILFGQINSFLIYILIVAALISFLINHILDGIAISVILVLNTAIGFFQQYKAEKAIINLRKLIVPKSKVIRNSRMIEISSLELVPGDIILLNSGDKINADCRIIEAENLQANEAILTGESLPIDKSKKKLSQETILAEQENMLFTGTQVVRGTSKAVVVSTGMNTVFGKIAEKLQSIEIQKTPMQNRLDKFSKQIGVFVLIFVGIILLLGFTAYFDLFEMFLIAIALAVSAIPEGLPAVLTISFAISSLIMSKQNVIIRRLPAVESLGSVTVICSDKTGTITEEKMHVQKIFSDNRFYLKENKNILLKNKKIDLKSNKELYQLLKTSVLCNNARFELVDGEYHFLGDPTEESLLSAALDLGINKKSMIEKEPSIEKFEFSSDRKMMSIVRNSGRHKIVYSKGAPEKIIKICGSELIGGKIQKLTEKRKKELMQHSQKMEQEALRVLGFAFKNFNFKEKVEEKGLIFLGFIGMIDPPRKEVKEAIKQCKDAGIKIKIITGDSITTAVAIAKQIGISGRAVTEEELQKMSDATLMNSIDEISIFARTTPSQKLRITKILQQKNEVVAITGDGINDVLALKSADVGVSMGQRGTDVARDVSDIILVDDNFASIVEGVKQGRRTYDNVKKFTKYFLAVNFDEILLVLFALVMGAIYSSNHWFLPLLPLQILWINLITDSLPALSLIFEKQESVMKSKPREEKSILDNIWKFILVAGLFAFAVSLIVYLYGRANFSEAKTQTLVLTIVILFELLFVYACRSNKPLTKIGIFSNKWMNLAVAISLSLHLILLYTPLSSLFGVVPLSFSDWIFLLPLAFSGLIVFELGKYFLEGKNVVK